MSKANGNLPKYTIEAALPTCDGGTGWVRAGGSSLLVDAKGYADRIAADGWSPRPGDAVRPISGARVTLRDGTVKHVA